jgi:hypothetical protein
MFKYPFHTSQEARCVSITTATGLMLCREIGAANSENRAEHVNALRGQNTELLHMR